MRDCVSHRLCPPALLCPLALLTSCLQATRGHDPRAVGIRVELEVVAKVVCRGTRWRRRAERLVALQRERVRRVKLCGGDRLVLERQPPALLELRGRAVSHRAPVLGLPVLVHL